jgi:thiamine biosynthesis protein ThiI
MALRKGLCLISSGIDSPVAAHILLNQNLYLDCVNFINNPRDKSSITFIKNIIDKLEKIHKNNIKLYVMNFYETQKKIANTTFNRYHCLICKRMMYRISENFCKVNYYDFLVTGENLGQVASQTLDNLFVLDNAVNISVLRPLLSYDKKEIIKKAKKIGTFIFSIKNNKKCPFVPANPITKAKLKKIQNQEKKLNIDKLVNESINKIKMIK